MKFNKVYMAPILLMGLSACSDDSDSIEASSSGSKETTASKNVVASPQVKNQSSKLSAFLSDDKVCDVIDLENLKSTFKITSELKASAHSYSENYTCTYSWDRADAAARESLMVDFSKKTPMRLKVPSSEVSVTLSKARRTVDNFVPRKLTPAQLQAQIDAAKAAAEKRLTDEQKAVAGDAANKMVEKMMQKNNQNQEINGLGDAAYWSKIGFGNMNILSGGINVSISLMVADTEEEDMENAKLAFNMLKK